MLNYEVSGFNKPEADILCIKIRVKEGNEKKGFILEVNEEWIQKHLHQVVEGMEYPKVRMPAERNSMVPRF